MENETANCGLSRAIERGNARNLQRGSGGRRDEGKKREKGEEKEGRQSI